MPTKTTEWLKHEAVKKWETLKHGHNKIMKNIIKKMLYNEGYKTNLSPHK